MAVPAFYVFMRPVLETLSNGTDFSFKELTSTIASATALSPDDQAELLPSKTQTKFHNRVRWALSYLRQAKLVESSKKGVYGITERGRRFLEGAPSVIKPADLMVFPEFVAFQQASKGKTGEPTGKPIASVVLPDVLDSKLTPDEIMDEASKELFSALTTELLGRVKEMSPQRFEGLIVELMLRLGYGGPSGDSGVVLGKSGDNGVDGVISQDKLGLEKIYLQAKRYTEKTVSKEEVQAFAGALAGQQAVKGVFITTSGFTSGASQYAKTAANFKISLINGLELARLMVECNLGVSLKQTYEVKRVDSDFFGEE
jgi:restriction system protein